MRSQVSKSLTWLGVDLGDAFAAEVDPRGPLDHHVLAAVAAAGVDADYVAIHMLGPLTPGAPAGWGVSVRSRGPLRSEPRSRLLEALGGRADVTVAALSASARAGRCVRFPGQHVVTGQVTVADLLGRTAIDRVAGSGTAVAYDDVVETSGYLRPCFEAGRLTLRVSPSIGGILVPAEAATRYECCAEAH
jgi:hypothetical protein